MSNVAVVRGAYEAFERGDIEAVLGAMDPSIEWHEAEGHPYWPSGEAIIGPDAVLSNLFMRLEPDWDGFAVHPQVFHDAGAVVAVEGRQTGIHKETGKQLDCQICHIWTVEGGKLKRFQQYADTGQLQDVMGRG